MAAGSQAQTGGDVNTSSNPGGRLQGVLRDIGSAVGELFGGGRLGDAERLRVEVFFSLLGFLAKADGIITSHESEFVNTLMDEFKLSIQGREVAHQAFERGRTKQLDVQAEVDRFLAAHPKGSAEVEGLYDTLLRLAASDGRLYARERAAMETLSTALGYGTDVMERRLQAIMAGG
jgi:DnaJ like chaperone protein